MRLAYGSCVPARREQQITEFIRMQYELRVKVLRVYGRELALASVATDSCSPAALRGLLLQAEPGFNTAHLHELLHCTWRRLRQRFDFDQQC
jgi:hypothetical protein